MAVSPAAFRRYRRNCAASCCGWDAVACGAPSPRSGGPARASHQNRVQPPLRYGPCPHLCQSVCAAPVLRVV